MTMEEFLNFRTNVQLKSIIGKDLINDDNIAILELVKNSFDANAKQVRVKFLNLKDNDDLNIKRYSAKTSRIIISDNGIGMNFDDIKNKWLNIAYSEKKLNSTQHQRLMAGAKGVGRFSCDRLGEYLNLYSKNINSEDYIKIEIDWKKFEVEDENKEIQSVSIKTKFLSAEDLKKIGIRPFKHGVYLEIIKLRSKWISLTNNKGAEIWNTDKLTRLKKYLEKLINPHQALKKDDFRIYIEIPELERENAKLEDHEKFLGEVKSRIFEKLDFKTTSIESKTIDGNIIYTELKDKGEVIFWIKEKNLYGGGIENIKLNLYYLNPYSKAFFTRQTGIQPVNYGSIFLFINGFRIPPYGDFGDDWLGLDQRKSQGMARYIGLREIVGSVEILDRKNDFPIISSREGIVKNDNYNKLTSSSRASEGFIFKALKRLERYVVDGLNWDSLPDNILYRDIEKKIKSGEANEDELVYKEDISVKRRRIYESIHTIIAASPKNVLELYVNDKLIYDKIAEEKKNAEREFESLIADFEHKKIDADTLSRILKNKIEKNEELEKQLKNFNKFTTNESTSDAIRELCRYKNIVEEQAKVIENLRQKLNEYSQESDTLKKEKRAAEQRAFEERKKRKETEEELENEIKRGAFKGALIGTDKERIIALQHQIFHSSGRIATNVKRLISHIGLDNIDSATEKYISIISLEASKIYSIANFITKANFNSKADKIVSDIVDFSIDYLNEIYIVPDRIIKDLPLEIEIDNSFEIKYEREFRPLEITSLFDNFIHNSVKAKAKKIKFAFSLSKGGGLIIEILDDGRGIEKSNIPKVFDLGYTTTKGSGIGLYHIKNIVKELNGNIIVDSIQNKYTKFVIKI